jgi:hypothetical protein
VVHWPVQKVHRQQEVMDESVSYQRTGISSTETELILMRMRNSKELRMIYLQDGHDADHRR